MLHVTNGESVALRDTSLGGRVLFWNDVLHEGPVPGGLPLPELSRVRAKFLADYFELDGGEVSFAERDGILARFPDHEEVVLWFEHDLYDQLQLIQILDWFAMQNLGSVRLSLICGNEYLGMMTTDRLTSLFPTRQTVTAAEFKTAQKAWSAFCAPQPLELTELLKTNLSALPFLRGALLRHLQQFPAADTGLSRTERQILQLVESGLHSWGELFVADQKLEESIFMGDTTYQQYLRGLVKARRPLLKSIDDSYEITPLGRDVLGGREDHVRANGINRWLGGVHLCEGAPIWRWDDQRQAIRP